MSELSQDVSPGSTAGASTETSSDTAASSTAPTTEQSVAATNQISSGNVQTDSSEAQQQDSTPDPLEGLPTVDELRQQAQQGVKYAEALANIRGAYEKVKPDADAYAELNPKLTTWQPVMDSLGDVERANQAVQLHDALHGWDTDPLTGQLVPSTQRLAEAITGADAERADLLALDLLDGTTQRNGQAVKRLDMVLNILTPDELIGALKQRDGYKDIEQKLSQEAPYWTVTPEELQDIPPEYHDLYKTLSPEVRSELARASLPFVEDYLRRAKAEKDTEVREQTRQRQEQEYKQQQQQVLEKAAVSAGDAHVNTQIREGLSELINNIRETWKPTDNEQVNDLAGSLVGAALVALSHKETRFAAEDVLTKLGLIDKGQLSNGFDTALNDFVSNTYNAGYLRHKDQNAQVDGIAHKANLARQKSVAQLQGIATRIIAQLSSVFTGQATAHNQTLDAGERGRPIALGAALNPASDMRIQPSSDGNPFSDENNRRVVNAYARS